MCMHGHAIYLLCVTCNYHHNSHAIGCYGVHVTVIQNAPQIQETFMQLLVISNLPMHIVFNTVCYKPKLITYSQKGIYSLHACMNLLHQLSTGFYNSLSRQIYQAFLQDGASSAHPCTLAFVKLSTNTCILTQFICIYIVERSNHTGIYCIRYVIDIMNGIVVYRAIHQLA